MTGALLASSVAHITVSDLPLLEAAGKHLLWRAAGAIMVIGLVQFVLAGIVMLALILGRTSWAGMLAGLGYFAADLYAGGWGPPGLLEMVDAYRITVSYHALGLFEQLFAPHPYLSLQRSWPAGAASPGRSVGFLLLYGCALTALSFLCLRRQDLMTRQ